MDFDNREFRLTQYSAGAGCGCKIGPKILENILKNLDPQDFPRLLAGINLPDDAAIWDNGDRTATISTLDFFTPIVDHPFDFGCIAAANALSDVYAMGARPVFALAILGWPVEKIPVQLASETMKGAQHICQKAGIPIAGGHSIAAPEPFFGLSVSGTADIHHIKTKHGARPGDVLLLTKPLGTGILTTALKRGLLREESLREMMNYLLQLNEAGLTLGRLSAVHAMTDVTGFGLLGHLREMMETHSGLSAVLSLEKIPVLNGVVDYIRQFVLPDATTRNWSHYAEKVSFADGVPVMEAFALLADPQTNGGLLVSVGAEGLEQVMDCLRQSGIAETFCHPIGYVREKAEKVIFVET